MGKNDEFITLGFTNEGIRLSEIPQTPIECKRPIDFIAFYQLQLFLRNRAVLGPADVEEHPHLLQLRTRLMTLRAAFPPKASLNGEAKLVEYIDICLGILNSILENAAAQGKTQSRV